MSEEIRFVLDMDHVKVPQTVLSIPMANEDDRNEGWTLDPTFLDNLADAAQGFGGFTPSPEDAESVLMALFEMPNVQAT